MKIYTLGYQGLSIVEYTRFLREAEVRRVLDVRDHAWSQRPEYVKSALQYELARARIDYVHTPYVGNPPEIRKEAKSAADCLRKFRKHILRNAEVVKTLFSLIKEASTVNEASCLTCYESNAEDCHRSVLTDHLLLLDSRIEVIHLPLPQRRRSTSLSARNDSLEKSAYVQPYLLPLRKEAEPLGVTGASGRRIRIHQSKIEHRASKTSQK